MSDEPERIPEPRDLMLIMAYLCHKQGGMIVAPPPSKIFDEIEGNILTWTTDDETGNLILTLVGDPVWKERHKK